MLYKSYQIKSERAKNDKPPLLKRRVLTNIYKLVIIGEKKVIPRLGAGISLDG